MQPIERDPKTGRFVAAPKPKTVEQRQHDAMVAMILHPDGIYSKRNGLRPESVAEPAQLVVWGEPTTEATFDPVEVQAFIDGNPFIAERVKLVEKAQTHEDPETSILVPVIGCVGIIVALIGVGVWRWLYG